MSHADRGAVAAYACKGRTSLPRVHWIGGAFNFSGYARVTRELLPSLVDRGIDVHLEPMATDQKFLAALNRIPTEVTFWNRLLAANGEGGVCFIFHPPVQWNGYPVFRSLKAKNPGFDAYIGVTMFETDRLPPRWAADCNAMDEVWVPSTFNVETFARAGVDPKKLRVIPLGIDGRGYANTQSRYPLANRAGFNFLSVFQWTARKGWDVLLDAYLDAFTRDDDVALHLRTYPSYKKTPTIAERVRRHMESRGIAAERAPRISLIEEFVSDLEMPSLYRAADAYVLPTRGEGWGLPFMEAMASGVPVIGTRWGSQLDFMNEENSYLVDLSGLVPVANEQVEEDPYYGGGQFWANPDRHALARTMRRVFENRDEAKARAARGQKDVLTLWTREKSAAEFERLLSAVPLKKPADDAVPEKPADVLWASPIFDPSGYADEARTFVAGLDEIDFPVKIRPIDWSRRSADLSTDETTRLLELEARPIADRAIAMQHIFPPCYARFEDAVATVGRTMFETDRIPAEWVPKCNEIDEIWVPSDFNIETFARSGVRREILKKVPGAIDDRRWGARTTPLRLSGRRGYNFLSIFDWSRRKGWDVLIRAFVEEFKEEEDVALFLRVHSSIELTTDQLYRAIENYIVNGLNRPLKSVPTIWILGEDVPSADMPSLYRAADAYVMPSRGEGWGRPYMEAMATGLPTIGTRWSGQLEFMNDANSMLVDYSMIDVDPVAVREAPHFRGHRWAEPDVLSLRRAMREVFENRAQAKALGAAAREDILTKFSRRRVAGLIRERFDYLLGRR